MVFEPKRAEKETEVADACSALVRRRRGSQVSGHTEDTVQDACVRALQISAPQAVQNPVRYLMRITRNLFIDSSRRRTRDARIFQHTDDLTLVADERPGPEQFLADKQMLARVMAEIDRLPPRCRQAFLLHRFENMSYPIIARRMEISVSMVEKHIADAMVKLEKVRNTDKGFS